MIIPVMFGAIFLGRAFDLQSVQSTSKWIFDQDIAQANKLILEAPYTRSEYRLIESSSDLQSSLDISGNLAIKLKNQDIKIEGSGSYFTNQIDRDKTVELLMTIDYQTVIETLPSYAEMKDDWQKLSPSEVGTHYIRSIVYGGQLIVSYQLKTNSSENLEEIKAAVNVHLEVAGSVDADVKGKLEKIDKAVGSKSTLFIRAYSTAGEIGNQPQTLEDTFDLIDRYPKQVKEINEGKGAAMKIELVPLSTLNQNFGGELKSQTINEVVTDVMDKLDDLQNAEDKYKDWVYSIPEEMFQESEEFEKRMNIARRAITGAISDLDLSKPMDINHFDEAIKKYAEGDANIPYRYTRELEALIYKAKKITPRWYPYTRAVTHYIHWGSVSCTLPSPEPLVAGLAASAPTGFGLSDGSGANLQCLNLEPKLDNAVSNTIVSGINGLSFRTPDGKTGTLFCAHCKLENATTTITVPAQEICPVGMKLEYQGYLATGLTGVTEPICIDLNPDVSYENVYVKEDKTANVMKPMWINCDDCNNDDDDEYDPTKYYIPCVVCSR